MAHIEPTAPPDLVFLAVGESDPHAFHLGMFNTWEEAREDLVSRLPEGVRDPRSEWHGAWHTLTSAMPRGRCGLIGGPGSLRLYPAVREDDPRRIVLACPSCGRRLRVSALKQGSCVLNADARLKTDIEPLRPPYVYGIQCCCTAVRGEALEVEIALDRFFAASTGTAERTPPAPGSEHGR